MTPICLCCALGELDEEEQVDDEEEQVDDDFLSSKLNLTEELSLRMLSSAVLVTARMP